MHEKQSPPQSERLGQEQNESEYRLRIYDLERQNSHLQKRITDLNLQLGVKRDLEKHSEE